ncbi:hypothetical protein CCACVL1_00291, partial [Corchorus capsularis]
GALFFSPEKKINGQFNLLFSDHQ